MKGINPHRAYSEDTAGKIQVAIGLAKLMAKENYPHLLSTIIWAEKRMAETEIVFDLGKSQLRI